jgi:hypothetical protein
VHQLIGADAEGAHDLLPGVVRGGRDEDDSGRQRIAVFEGEPAGVFLVADVGEGVVGERPGYVGPGSGGPQRIPQVQRRVVRDVEELPEREPRQLAGAAVGEPDGNRKPQLRRRPRRGDRQVADTPGQPEGLEVGDGAARGQVTPAGGRVVADHRGEL